MASGSGSDDISSAAALQMDTEQEIRRLAEREANELLSQEVGASGVHQRALLKTTGRIEAHLLRRAAREAWKQGGPLRRRLLAADPSPPVDEAAAAASTSTSVSMFSTKAGSRAYRDWGFPIERPTPAAAAPFCTIVESTALEMPKYSTGETGVACGCRLTAN